MTSTAPLSLHPQPRMKVCMLACQRHSKAPDCWATTSTATSAVLTHCRLTLLTPRYRHRRCRAARRRRPTATLPAAAALPPPSPRRRHCCRAAAATAAPMPTPAPPPSLQCRHHRRAFADAALPPLLPALPSPLFLLLSLSPPPTSLPCCRSFADADALPPTLWLRRRIMGVTPVLPPPPPCPHCHLWGVTWFWHS